MTSQSLIRSGSILLLDNYDSFTDNLANLLRTSAPWARIIVRRNDELTVADALALSVDLLVVSPGPGRPEESGITLSLIDRWPANLGLLGVCLGHQALGVSAGATLSRSRPVHGKTCRLRHRGGGLFAGLPDSLQTMRYHSLALTNVPRELEVTAWADGEPELVLGVRHRERPWQGVQFHPESFRSEHGVAMVRTFLRQAPGNWRFPSRL